MTLRDADNNPVDAKEAVTVTVTLPDGTTTDVEIGADSSSNSVTFTVENDIYDIDSVSAASRASVVARASRNWSTTAMPKARA
ncbi:hypothetical protein LZI70_20545 (plasmid) [Vibrio pelagius]|uniref:Bacterial Ig-like domain-containing protein n=1 Tax=Vibrio pelagius TaxID=28169 RepID=A0ABY5GAT2_VIBPE|nr:hypothetical protein [Vibrio pelagius]UTT87321.1 hypothetical protein LZI70_20545 [Vibrio pelagius]